MRGQVWIRFAGGQKSVARAVWDSLGQFGTVWDSLGQFVGQFGTVWDSLGQFWDSGMVSGFAGTQCLWREGRRLPSCIRM